MDKDNKKYILFCFIITIALIITFCCSFVVGRFSHITFGDVIHIAMNKLFSTSFLVSDKSDVVLLKLRLPRIIGACLIGAALALSGAAYQALFGNPIASPDTLGVSNAASFAAVLGILLEMGNIWTKLTAFVVGTITVMMVFFVASVINKGRSLTMYLLLIGMVVSSLFSALLTILKYIADPDDKLPQITYWLMGSLSKISATDIKIFLIFFVVGAVPLFFLKWRLDILSLNDAEIKSIGENTIVFRMIVIFCATLLTASATAITGGISWVGLIIPHVVRRIVGPNFRRVIPASCLTGALFLLVMDNLARSISVNELPISILTSLVGAPLFFIILLLNKEQISNDT